MKYATIITLLLLILAACTQAAPPATPEPAAPTAPTAPTAQPPAAAPGPTPVEVKPMPTSSKELQDLLSRADQKVKSYKYLELILPDKKQPDTVWVKGSKIKIKMYEYEPYDPATYFDTVYLDTAAKSIIGRCESNKRCITIREDNTKKEWTDLDYDKFRPVTPYERLKQIPTIAAITGPEVHESRSTTKVEYDEGGKHYIAWIDDTFGIPLEIQVMTSDGERTTYKYNDPQFNTVTDADVTPP